MEYNRKMKKIDKPWILIEKTTADEFLLNMTQCGNPIETSLVGAFDKKGRGSRRDVDLPLHRDGDYSTKVAEKHSIDYVGLYCIRAGEAKTVIEHEGELTEFVLKPGQALIFDNKACRHARFGPVGDRLLIRVWVEK